MKYYLLMVFFNIFQTIILCNVNNIRWMDLDLWEINVLVWKLQIVQDIIVIGKISSIFIILQSWDWFYLYMEHLISLSLSTVTYTSFNHFCTKAVILVYVYSWNFYTFLLDSFMLKKNYMLFTWLNHALIIYNEVILHI